MSQPSAELPEDQAIDPAELSDQGAGLGFGARNTFEPEEEPEADTDPDAADVGPESTGDAGEASTDQG